jgi:radical SAM-linked protein
MRLRITFSKSGALRYIGHLDLHSLWERTVRRAGLPLSYTQGFHPGPRIQLASALPLGFIGCAEIVDLWINESPGSPELPIRESLQSSAPPGLVISSVEAVDENGPALQTQVAAAIYEITFLEMEVVPNLELRIAALLAAPSLPRERRGKTYDLRPLIELLELIPAEGSSSPAIRMQLAAREGATGRPEEVLDVLGLQFESTRIERTRLILNLS